MTTLRTTTSEGREVEATVETFLLNLNDRITGFKGHLSIRPNSSDKEFKGLEITGEHPLNGKFAVLLDADELPMGNDSYFLSDQVKQENPYL